MGKGKLCISLALIYLASLTQALPLKSLFKPNVVGGNFAPLGSVPHQVSLLSGGIPGRYFGCGGSILNENYILTAAHCAAVMRPGRSSVRAGFNTLNAPEEGFQTVAVSQIISHESYDPWTLANDIALLRLATPLKLNPDPSIRTAAVKLPLAGYTASGDVTVSGWGYTSEGSGILANKLNSVTIPIVSDDECRDAYGTSEVLESMLCAGIAAGGKDACQGDSGGPLVENSSGLLVGVVSSGNGCARPGFPGIYTEVSYYIDWIEKNIQEL